MRARFAQPFGPWRAGAMTRQSDDTAIAILRNGRLRADWETHIGVRDTFRWGMLTTDWKAR